MVSNRIQFNTPVLRSKITSVIYGFLYYGYFFSQKESKSLLVSSEYFLNCFVCRCPQQRDRNSSCRFVKSKHLVRKPAQREKPPSASLQYVWGSKVCRIAI